METQEVIRITNSGNARAKFKWQGYDKLFTISPKEGVVEANSFIESALTYVPNAGSANSKQDETQFTLKV